MARSHDVFALPPGLRVLVTAGAAGIGRATAETEKTYLDRVSRHRVATTEDVAATVLFLASETGRNVSGRSTGVNGNVESL